MVTKSVNRIDGSETYFRTVSGFGEDKRDYSCTVSANFEPQVGDDAIFLYPFTIKGKQPGSEDMVTKGCVKIMKAPPPRASDKLMVYVGFDKGNGYSYGDPTVEYEPLSRRAYVTTALTGSSDHIKVAVGIALLYFAWLRDPGDNIFASWMEDWNAVACLGKDVPDAKNGIRFYSKALT